MGVEGWYLLCCILLTSLLPRILRGACFSLCGFNLSRVLYSLHELHLSFPFSQQLSSNFQHLAESICFILMNICWLWQCSIHPLLRVAGNNCPYFQPQGYACNCVCIQPPVHTIALETRMTPSSAKWTLAHNFRIFPNRNNSLFCLYLTLEDNTLSSSGNLATKRTSVRGFLVTNLFLYLYHFSDFLYLHM